MSSLATLSRHRRSSSSTVTILSPPTPTIRLQALDPNAAAAPSTRKPTIPTSSPTDQVNQQHGSPFFRLPGELRNEIYQLLLSPDTKLLSSLATQHKHITTQHRTPAPKTPVTLYPAILSTCRKAHLEATPLLYSTHVFNAHNSLLTSLPHLTSAYRPVLHPRPIGLIRRWQLSLRLDTDPRFTAEQAKAAFSGAEYLEVRVWEAQFEMSNYAVLALLLKVRGVKVARVSGSVGEEVARWMERLMMSEEGEGEFAAGDGREVEMGMGMGETVLETGLERWRVGGLLVSAR